MITEDDKNSNRKIDPELLRAFMLGGMSIKDEHCFSEGTNVVDLHLNDQQDKCYSNGEKLYFQLESFQKKLDSAIANSLDRLVVIHGKGSGKLRKEINAILEKHPFVKSYRLVDEKYDQGATEITF